MTTAPYVELRFNPTDLRPQDIPRAGAYLGSPARAIEAALAVARASMVDQMKKEVRGLSQPTHNQLLRIADLAWQATFWRFRKVSAPVIADAYLHAYRDADAGDVPASLIYDLADKHAEKIGDYFHATSREALAEGFNGLVNRRVPARAAADRVLDAYGLTPRQMRTYTAAKQFDTPVSDVMPRSIKAKARAYIDKAFTTRNRKLSDQEEHNIDEQAKQLAWMWLQDKGRLNDRAQKMWLTAKDERVCPVCGPLHGKKVGINEKFVTHQGEFWSPGLHPNCRCELRLIENKFSKADWDPQEHPRGGDPENRGRFSRVASRPGPLFKEPDRPVIETTEEEAPVEMASETVEMVGNVEMNQKVEMTPVEMIRPEMTRGRAELIQPELTDERRRELLEMTVTPQMRLEMERSFADIIAEGERRRPTKRPKRVYDRPTISIQDENGHEYPVYAVVDRNDDVNWHGGKMQLHQDVRFYTSQSQAYRIATDKFEQAIEDEYDAIIGSGRHNQKQWLGNQQYELIFDEEDVYNAVIWTAYQGRVPEGMEAPTHSSVVAEFHGTGPTSEIIEREMSLNEAARLLNIDRRNFDVQILRMDEGHASYEGQTTELEHGTRKADQVWVTEGIYNVTPLHGEMVDETLSLQLNYIEPDVEETERPLPRGILD